MPAAALMNEPTLMPKRRDVPSRTVGEELLVRDPASERVHFLNSTAAVVWECCDGATPLSACVDRVRETFAVPDTVDLAADVRETLEHFRQQGLLEG
jgi:hypothetical protein